MTTQQRVARRIDTRNYPASAYDDQWCLKPPVLLWIAVLFLDRAALMPLLMGFGHWANVNEDAMRAMRGLWAAEGLLPALMTLPVLWAAFRRVPDAGAPFRWIWTHGRALLLLAVVADAGLNVLAGLRAGDATLALLLCGAFDLYFGLYLLFARRVRDSFADFPTRIDASAV